MHFHQMDTVIYSATAHCGTVSRLGARHCLTKLCCYREQGRMQTLSFSYTCFKVPYSFLSSFCTLFCASLAAAEKINVLGQWFPPWWTSTEDFCKSSSEYFHCIVQCIFNHLRTESKIFAVDGLETKTYFRERGKKDESSFLHWRNT